jgi:hypothetical protein
MLKRAPHLLPFGNRPRKDEGEPAGIFFKSNTMNCGGLKPLIDLDQCGWEIA